MTIQIYNYKLCLSAMVEMNKGLGGRGIGQLHLFGELKMSKKAWKGFLRKGYVESRVIDEETLTQ